MHQDLINRSIILQSSRTVTENPSCRIATTTISDPEKTSPLDPSLFSVKDYTLAQQQSVSLCASGSQAFLTIVPITGSMEYYLNDGISYTLNPGEIIKICPTVYDRIEIRNPFKNDLINFIIVEILLSLLPGSTSNPERIHKVSQTGLIESFDINSDENKLVPVCALPDLFRCYIGKFEAGRVLVFSTRKSRENIFIYIIDGSFEAAGYLLKESDGLLLSGKNEYEWKARSDNSIIMLIEFPA